MKKRPTKIYEEKPAPRGKNRMYVTDIGTFTLQEIADMVGLCKGTLFYT